MTSSFFTVHGKVIALSHIFRVSDGELIYFIKLQDDNKVNNVLVFAQSHSAWHSAIEHESCYSISNVSRGTVKLKEYEIPIWETTNGSQLVLLYKENFRIDNEFISYTGTVTGVIEEDLGVYELDGSTLLISAYLKGIVGDIRKNNSLEIGQVISLFNFHKLIDNVGRSTLVCCGKSFLKLSSQQVEGYKEFVHLSNIGVIHCLHRYNLGIDFFYWLLELQKVLLSVLPCNQNPDIVTKRECYGKEGALVMFLRSLEPFEDLKIKINHRSILSEALLPQHSCVIVEEFQQPLRPVLIEDLHFNNAYFNQAELVWKYLTTKSKTHKWVVFGVLRLANQSGFFTLETRTDVIYVCLFGDFDGLYEKIDNLVAIIDFDLVEECFNIFPNGGTTKKYIIVDSLNVLSLVPMGVDAGTMNEEEQYEIKVNFKTGLCFKYNEFLREEGAFFVCNTVVTCNKNYRQESWSVAVCFRGKFAKYFPLVRGNTRIRGRLKSIDIGDVAFKKTYSFSFLRNFQTYFGTVECVNVPDSFVVDCIECRPFIASYSVRDVIEGKVDPHELLTVEGLILDRYLMTSTFDSELTNIPQSLLSRQIGLPGNKLMRLFLQDRDYPDAKIYVYINRTTECNIQQYPLCVIPGVRVKITWLKLNKSKKENIYLASTNCTYIEVTANSSTLTEAESNSGLALDRTFLQDVGGLRPNGVIRIMGTVSYIYCVNFNLRCPACNCDFRNGLCSYIGCHSKRLGVLGGNAKFLVDDGTGTITVFTNDVEHIKILANVNSNQWSVFLEYLKTQSMPISISNKDCLSSNVHILGAHSLFCLSRVLRPVILMCRIFKKSDTPLSPDLFLIRIRNLNPNSDWNEML